MSTVKKRCPDRSSYLRQSSDELRGAPDAAPRKRSSGLTMRGGRRRRGRGARKEGEEGEDAAEIPVTYDKRDNGLSNYPAERLNRAAMPKSVLSASFFSPYVLLARASRGWNPRGGRHASSSVALSLSFSLTFFPRETRDSVSARD